MTYWDEPDAWHELPRIEAERPPTQSERNMASHLANALRRNTIPGVGINSYNTAKPPGRLHKREAMRFVIEQDRGVVYSTAKPFIRQERVRGKYSAPKVAVMGDVSGSMYSNQEAMGVLRFAITDAVRQVQGKVSVTLFGNYGIPIQLAGDHIPTVQTYTAPGSGENFSDGIAYVAADLDLFDNHDGARVLIVITDGNFVYKGEAAVARDYMAECKRQGVAVLWVHPTGRWRGPDDTFGFGELVVGDPRHPNAAKLLTEAVGKATINQIQRIKSMSA